MNIDGSSALGTYCKRFIMARRARFSAIEARDMILNGYLSDNSDENDSGESDNNGGDPSNDEFSENSAEDSENEGTVSDAYSDRESDSDDQGMPQGQRGRGRVRVRGGGVRIRGGGVRGVRGRGRPPGRRPGGNVRAAAAPVDIGTWDNVTMIDPGPTQLVAQWPHKSGLEILTREPANAKKSPNFHPLPKNLPLALFGPNNLHILGN